MVTLERYFQHHMRIWINRISGNISILDVGCGTGHIGLWLAGEYPMITANCQSQEYDSRHQKKDINIIGLDSYEPAIRYLRELGIYREVRNHDISSGLKSEEGKQYDIALAYGVLAHLEKDAALDLVEDMTAIADHVIVTAPTQMCQHENIDNSASIEQLRHKSKFRCRDFEELGLETRLLTYKEDPDKTTALNTFLSPYIFGLSATHQKLKEKYGIPYSLTHWLNRGGDGILAWV